MAVLKFTVIIFLIFIAKADGRKKDKCCQKIESKVDELKSMLQNLESKGPACPKGWVHHGESCYLVINIPTLKQRDARRTCQNLGGDLAIIRSEEENNFIFNLVKQQQTVTEWGVWLGFTRKSDDKFYWIDGAPLAGQYSPWGAGEPNNAGEKNEDCGNMFGSGNRPGKWNDLWCDLTESWQLKLAPSVLCQKKSE